MGAAHMQTSANGVTRWASGLFRVGVNRWYGGSGTGWYVQTDSPTNSQFQLALAVTIDTFRPFAASTVEWNGGAHYNHPQIGKDIGHWLAVYGYNNNGARAYFADPATYWSGVQEKFSYNSNSFNQTFMQQNGMAW
jgi:hypothetical protein